MDALRYFFGTNAKGEAEFKYFSFAHFLPLIILGGLIYLIYRYREKLRSYAHEDNIRFVLATIMMICEMSYFWRLINSDVGSNSYDNLPITICGWACITCSIMLYTKKKFFFNISYFWVLALSFNALITPVPLLRNGITRFRFYQYWIEHMTIYIAVFYMIFVHKIRPFFKSFIPAGAALLILGAIAVAVNVGLGTSPDGQTTANYLYIATTEDSFSIANLLPSNLFLRYFIIIFLVALLFFLAYLPWFIMDLRKKIKDAETQNIPKEQSTDEISTATEQTAEPAITAEIQS